MSGQHCQPCFAAVAANCVALGLMCLLRHLIEMHKGLSVSISNSRQLLQCQHRFLGLCMCAAAATIDPLWYMHTGVLQERRHFACVQFCTAACHLQPCRRFGSVHVPGLCYGIGSCVMCTAQATLSLHQCGRHTSSLANRCASYAPLCSTYMQL